MWKLRFAAYLSGFLGIAATLAATFGWGTYDQTTGLFDPPPIDVKGLAGFVIAGLGNVIAALAVMRGWGRK